MATGIRAAIVERLALSDEEDLGVLRVILNQRVMRPAYQRALMAKGAMRHDLDGNPVAPVSDEHRAKAKATYAALTAAKQKGC